ncbi:glycosyltransferase family 1 protein [Flavobacterium circumlabens]|uniref:Glycosyltransferase family 1 protein n=1 Tax=Flavobacterium circumlabens TaxID=2133765 RepID=A0A4Y7UB31_9FLAO|nr:glycosyltransferase family 4 protein [Flavobacterium circumlabens]TCN56407.1 glycosyltransferase involved in cell wall biosynthesis [Flavobacterium circumlabens]TEB43441.1 glycosyltransferase family 1 protein [Flavobacterium circumlabens]
MHICFLTNEYPKEGFPHGGIGSFVKTLAVALVKKGIRVSVIGINYTLNDETETVDGVRIYRLKPSNVKMISWYFNFKAINKKIKEIHKDYPITIVEASELGLAFIKKIKNIKYIIRLHGGHHFFAESENRKVNKWKGFQEKRSFKNSDAFIAVSQYVKSHTEKYLSYNDKPVSYIYNPINTALFQPIIKEIPASKIVFVGTVCEKKGIRQLIQAFPLVKKEYPDATLEIYGRDWFFPDGSSYTQLLKEKELPRLAEIASHIHFHGPVPYTEIPNVYAGASICVFPSHMETQGLVAPEAMAMEKAVVFTQLGPGPETIENYKTGLLCDPHSPADIAEKIIWIFANREKAIEMGKTARQVVLEKYGLEHIVFQNIDFYNM